MTKSELILAISAKMPHLPAADVEVVVNTMFDSMAGALEGGDRIEIRGFEASRYDIVMHVSGVTRRLAKPFRCRTSACLSLPSVTNYATASTMPFLRKMLQVKAARPARLNKPIIPYKSHLSTWF